MCRPQPEQQPEQQPHDDDHVSPAFVKMLLPNVVCWPEGASPLFFQTVYANYFRQTSVPNLLDMIQSAPTTLDALKALQDVFTTHPGRTALIELAAEHGCAAEEAGGRWETIGRYAAFAFVLEGCTVTCGNLDRHP